MRGGCDPALGRSKKRRYVCDSAYDRVHASFVTPHRRRGPRAPLHPLCCLSPWSARAPRGAALLTTSFDWPVLQRGTRARRTSSLRYTHPPPGEKGPRGMSAALVEVVTLASVRRARASDTRLRKLIPIHRLTRTRACTRQMQHLTRPAPFSAEEQESRGKLTCSNFFKILSTYAASIRALLSDISERAPRSGRPHVLTKKCRCR